MGEVEDGAVTRAGADQGVFVTEKYRFEYEVGRSF